MFAWVLVAILLSWVCTDSNREPIAMDDEVSGLQGQPLTIAVLGNDSDPDGDTLTIHSVIKSPKTNAAINGDRLELASYGPCGDDKMEYKVSDAHGGFASATVRIHVKCPTVELAESTFAFAAHALTRDGEKALAAFVAQLHSATGRVSIVGHACQIGSKQENIKLSLRRATTVFEALSALVKKEGLPGITVDRPIGVGDSDPKKGVNCDHLRGDRRMFEQYKACLSPNRRVVVALRPTRQAGKDPLVD